MTITNHTMKPKRRWSKDITQHSDAMTLEGYVFTRSPSAIAHSLKRSAEHSQRLKSAPFQSAMSMLTFYINRAGKNLTRTNRKKLESAKNELRKVFGQKPRNLVHNR